MTHTKSPPKSSHSPPFSDRLEQWLGSNHPKTLGGLYETFAEKSFAPIIMVLMFLPALPIPTGGVTHVLEAIVMLLCVLMIINPRAPMPRRLRHRPLGKLTEKKAAPFIVKRVRWIERYSRPRLSSWFERRAFVSLIGLLLLVCTIAAFVSPPFSGLDTLPAMGAVAIALSLILEDMALLVIGILVATAGIGLEIGLGATLTHFVRHLVH